MCIFLYRASIQQSLLRVVFSRTVSAVYSHAHECLRIHIRTHKHIYSQIHFLHTLNRAYIPPYLYAPGFLTGSAGY